MHLYVVRHGTTYNNVEDLINGRNDIDLNEQGVKEAGRASFILKDIKFDKIYCSPLIRAKHTMQIINCNNFPVEYDERLAERDSGVMTNHPVAEIDINLWYSLTPGLIYGSAESFKGVITRVDSFIKDLRNEHENDTVLVVAHGDVMKAIEVIIFGYPGAEEVYEWSHPNCCIRDYRL